MRYYKKEQMQEMEHKAVERGVSMEQLMEYAGGAAARFIQRKYELRGKRVAILCGKGNNGGDGYVAARLLRGCGAYVSVVLAEGFPATDLARQAYGRMGAGVISADWGREPRAVRQAVSDADIIIDGLYGFGFRGAMPEYIGVLAELANQSRAPVISLDIPSGVECNTGAVHGPCIRADYTVTFTVPKPGHILYPGREYCGQVVPAAAGIPGEVVEQAVPALETLEPAHIKSLFRPRDSQSNKGDYGKLLCVCGSEGMAGAAIMCASAGLRCGAGLVNLALPRSIYPIAASRLLESVFTLLDREQDGSLTPETSVKLENALQGAAACVIGCGLGTAPGTPELVEKLLLSARCPVVLDADGLNAVSKHPEILREAAQTKPVIITPHPGEMARLMASSIQEVQADRLESASRFAREYGVITVLKGAGTLVAHPDGRTRMNLTGNPGMARGGSGDILTGMVGSFAAQGMEPLEAASAAVYLHGLAGDRCADRLSQQGMLPTDMLSELPNLFLEYAM